MLGGSVKQFFFKCRHVVFKNHSTGKAGLATVNLTLKLKGEAQGSKTLKQELLENGLFPGKAWTSWGMKAGV